MKKHWKKGLALGLSFLMAFEAPAVLSSALSESYGAERTATVTATALNVRSGPGTPLWDRFPTERRLPFWGRRREAMGRPGTRSGLLAAAELR